MQAKHLKANVRNQGGVAVIDLDGEINAFSEQALNAAYAEAAGSMKGVLEYSTDPLVSSDIVGNPHSTIFDSLATMVMETRTVPVVAFAPPAVMFCPCPPVSEAPKPSMMMRWGIFSMKDCFSAGVRMAPPESMNLNPERS